jgi:hypothetical protein
MRKLFSLFFFCTLTLSFPCLVANASSLEFSVSSVSSVGRFYMSEISGTLTLDGAPVSNGLVAVEVMDSNNNMLFLRTVNTGTDPDDLTVQIQSVHASDAEGNAVDGFDGGDLAYFTVAVLNNDVTSQNILISVSVFDNFNCPVGFAAAESVVPCGLSTAILCVPVPSWINSGRAAVFAGAYSGLPSLQGVPLCPEVCGVFTINAEEGMMTPPSTSTGSHGTYSLGYVVPPKADTSVVYNVRVSSLYDGCLGLSDTFFGVYQPGDFNDDNVMNFNDINWFVNSYIRYFVDGVLDEEADFNNDGLMNFLDINSFVNSYIVYYKY